MFIYLSMAYTFYFIDLFRLSTNIVVGHIDFDFFFKESWLYGIKNVFSIGIGTDSAN